MAISTSPKIPGWAQKAKSQYEAAYKETETCSAFATTFDNAHKSNLSILKWMGIWSLAAIVLGVIAVCGTYSCYYHSHFQHGMSAVDITALKESATHLALRVGEIAGPALFLTTFISVGGICLYRRHSARQAVLERTIPQHNPLANPTGDGSQAAAPVR